MESKINQALAALDGVTSKDEALDKLLQIARSALIALKKCGTGSEEDALFMIADIARLADQAGLEITSEMMGEDYGPLVMPISDDLFHN